MKVFSSVCVAASLLLWTPAPAAAQDEQSVRDKACALGAAECTAPTPATASASEEEDGPRTPVETRTFCLLGSCNQRSAQGVASQPRVANLVRRPAAMTPGQSRPRQQPTPGATNMNLTFANNSADLSSDGQRDVRDWAKAIVTHPDLLARRYSVGGHTNSVGSRESNIDLSQRRAQAVVDYMVAQGVPRDHLSARGYGFDSPLPGMSAAAAANRRVVIVKN